MSTGSEEKASLDLSRFSGFFSKPLEERRRLIASPSASEEDLAKLSETLSNGGLSLAAADKMIENFVGILGMPVGVSPYFVINGRHFVVPMCTEEPSVIAAASSTSKLVYDKAGGFTASHTSNIMITQLQIKFAPDSKPESSTAGKTTFADALAAASKAAVILTERSAEVIEHANTFCTSMVARGGGVKGIEVHIRMPRKYLPSPANARQFFAGVVPNASEAKTSTSSSPDADADADVDVDGMPFLTLHLLVDVCDAMGANLVNTIAEGASPFITSLTGGTVGLRILSNLCVHRTVAASFRLPLDALAWKGVAGKEVAEKVVAAFQFARDDSFRACTHNKGAMNGIDAVALATGQDTRAVEASIHAYAATGGLYQPITSYRIDESTPEKPVLEGRIEVPIAVGTKGGSLAAHETFKWALQLLGNPDSATLAEVMACVGLAQNFAAMRALAIEGIQKGHMALHARKEGPKL